ncbi:MAG: diguanylate cyclase [Actinobacteria bacterium]|nr:diguanylate cyclase [Actinomycetota bacterium]
MTVTIITMPAVIFHFSIQFIADEIKKIHKIYFAAFYSISLIISALLISFNQISVQKITYGYTIDVPLLMFVRLFFLIPISIIIIFIISRHIYRNIKANKSMLAAVLLLTGFTFNFLGGILLNLLMRYKILQAMPVNEVSGFLLYFFISIGIFISNSRVWRITQNRIFRSVEDAVFAFETTGGIVEINEAAYDILKLDEKTDKKEKINLEYISNKLSALTVNKKQKKKFIEALTNMESGNYKEDIGFKTKGKEQYYNIRISPILDSFNKIIGKLLILIDITAIKEKEKQLYYQSYHDKLTGTYNRLYFEEELNRLDTKRQFPISIIIGDINGLKLINDAYGYNKGDEVLIKTAEILKSNLRYEDILTRWGGDEFAIILPKTKRKDAISIIDRIKESFFEHSTDTMPLNISMGFSVKITIGKKINEVIKEAENTMNEYKLSENESARSSIILSLKKALEERDYETEEHSKRMEDLSLLLGKKVNLKGNELNELRLLAVLHDIGKISIPDSIIFKPGKLTSKEWEIIKKHPVIGYRVARSSPDLIQIAKGILYHHERWDGKGYPEGLKGNKIPLISRIVAIVDAYDAMTNDRPYRKAMSKKKALGEIERESGAQFDPSLAKIFTKILTGESLVKIGV